MMMDQGSQEFATANADKMRTRWILFRCDEKKGIWYAVEMGCKGYSYVVPYLLVAWIAYIACYCSSKLHYRRRFLVFGLQVMAHYESIAEGGSVFILRDGRAFSSCPFYFWCYIVWEGIFAEARPHRCSRVNKYRQEEQSASVPMRDPPPPCSTQQQSEVGFAVTK